LEEDELFAVGDVSVAESQVDGSELLLDGLHVCVQSLLQSS
jgi:hypothetical protein